MSFQITTAFIKEFSDKVRLLSQQKDSKLRSAVNVETVHGEEAYFDAIGKTYPQTAVGRHAETKYLEVDHSRRRVTLQNYYWAALIEKLDEVQMLNSPQSKYASIAAMAMLRAYDKEIIDAALGTAATGKDGTGTSALPSSNIIASGSAGLTLAKVLQTKEILDGNNVDPEDRYFVTSSQQMSNMLNLEKVTSTNYTSVKALVEGSLDTYLGFKFIRIDGERGVGDPLLPKSNNDRSCFAFQKNAITLAVGKDLSTKITEMPNYNYATQVYNSARIGAVRIEDEGVVKVTCEETS